jgi:hypothetical protein
MALLLASTAACPGRLAAVGTGQGDGGVSSEDASTDGVTFDGLPGDERGPAPLPVCNGVNSQCLAPDAGVVWTGAAVITCQPEEYVGPWTLYLERQIGSSFKVVQTKIVQEPGFGATFYDTTGPRARLTYRVCVVDGATSARCGDSFTTSGPPNCACEPTSCYLLSACNTTVSDGCGNMLSCGACLQGMACNGGTCCGKGFMPDGWGNCVCAPEKFCPVWDWDTTDCSCHYGQ